MATLYTPEHVAILVQEAALSGTNALEEDGIPGLRDRVLLAVREATGITWKMPERLQTWVRQLCMEITAKNPQVFIEIRKWWLI